MIARRLRFLALAGVILLMVCSRSLGQGCTQCLDSTRATPPKVQAAYRHAIFLVGGVGLTFFVSGVLLLRSQR